MADTEKGDAPLPTTVLRRDNPYSGSSKCSQLEAEVLGEYARLADNIERVGESLHGEHEYYTDNVCSQLTAITNELASLQPDLLERITPLERKLGMVMTLFKVCQTCRNRGYTLTFALSGKRMVDIHGQAGCRGRRAKQLIYNDTMA